MSGTSFFSGIFGGSTQRTETVLEAPYKLLINKEAFIEFKTKNLYNKILQRCYSRSEGAKDDKKIRSLFDSKEKSGSPSGLISLISQAMACKSEVAIVYDAGVVRIADSNETKRIKDDYKATAMSKTGIIIDFKNYSLTDLVEGYMGMIYDILTSMNTQVGLATALQIKIANLRATVGLNGKSEPIEQAKEINASLNQGNSVLLDKNDAVEILPINSESVGKAITMVNSQLATDLGMPLSFVNGELTTGMSATGEADTNATEEGIQDFFNSIFKPACDPLYGWKLRFMSDDWRYFASMIGSLIAVENSGLLSQDQKQAFADRLMPNDKKG